MNNYLASSDSKDSGASTKMLMDVASRDDPESVKAFGASLNVIRGADPKFCLVSHIRLRESLAYRLCGGSRPLWLQRLRP